MFLKIWGFWYILVNIDCFGWISKDLYKVCVCTQEEVKKNTTLKFFWKQELFFCSLIFEEGINLTTRHAKNKDLQKLQGIGSVLNDIRFLSSLRHHINETGEDPLDDDGLKGFIPFNGGQPLLLDLLVTYCPEHLQLS